MGNLPQAENATLKRIGDSLSSEFRCKTVCLEYEQNEYFCLAFETELQAYKAAYKYRHIITSKVYVSESPLGFFCLSIHNEYDENELNKELNILQSHINSLNTQAA